MVAQIQFDGGRHQLHLDPELREPHLLNLNHPSFNATYSVSSRDAVKLALNIPTNYKKDPLDQNFFCVFSRIIFPGRTDRLPRQDRSKNQLIAQKFTAAIYLGSHRSKSDDPRSELTNSSTDPTIYSTPDSTQNSPVVYTDFD